MFNEELRFKHPIRWAMVGGGRGSQIGSIHRASALRDGLFQLMAGAFDINPETGKEFGVNLGLDPYRCYSDYRELFEKESMREDGIQAVSITTPNRFHYEIAKAALLAGLHIVCEKPLTFKLSEAEELKTIAEQKNLAICVTYGYTGFPMVHQARKMIENGDLGEIRIIKTQFSHGFHSEEVEKDNPGTKWRVTPEIAGSTYVLGDIGTHALFLAETMIPGLEIKNLLCTRQSFIASRAPLEDNATVLLNFTNNAVGTLWCSAVNAGSMHQQIIRIIGSKASIEWWDEHPNQLKYEIQGKPAQLLDRGMSYLYNDDPAVAANRIGGGHAEGLFESWANLYHRFGLAMQAKIVSDDSLADNLWYPGIDAGINGVKFLEKCVESADNGSVWVDFK
jgi:predicted dehydrogenase